MFALVKPVIHMDSSLANMTANIRVDTATKKGSVIDVIQLVCPNQTRQAATMAIEALKSTCPDMLSRIGHLRINSKGKLTPVADARTLVEIVWLLPGKLAREFRRKSSSIVCRVLGGDLAMIQEIEDRHCALSSTADGQQVQEFLIPDSAPPTKRYKGELPTELQLATTAQKASYFDVWLQQQKEQMQERKMEMMERKQQQDVAFVKQSYALLTELGVADERDKIAFGDVVRRLTNNTATASASSALTVKSSSVPDDPSVATPLCDPLVRGGEISMHSVSSKFNMKIGRGKEGMVGKAMKRLYLTKYGTEAAAAIPKRNVPFRGTVFAENAYWQRDEDLMKQALQEVCVTA